MQNRTKKPHRTPLHSLVKGFILTKATERKSSHTVRYYEQIFRGFLWSADISQATLLAISAKSFCLYIDFRSILYQTLKAQTSFDAYFQHFVKKLPTG